MSAVDKAGQAAFTGLRGDINQLSKVGSVGELISEHINTLRKHTANVRRDARIVSDHARGRILGCNNLLRGGTVEGVACMAHIRRKFVDIHASQGLATLEETIRRITELYAVEREVCGQPLDVCTQIRQAKAKPIFDDLQTRFGAQFTKISAKTPLAAAIR